MRKLSYVILSIIMIVILLTSCDTKEQKSQNDVQDIIKPTLEPTEQSTNSPTQSPTEEPADTLVGDWKKLNTETIMTLSEDGKIYEDKEYIADYEIIDNGTISFVTSSETILIEYEFDDGRLIWGTNFECYQAFTPKE